MSKCCSSLVAPTNAGAAHARLTRCFARELMRCVCSCQPQLSADDSGAPVPPHPWTHAPEMAPVAIEVCDSDRRVRVPQATGEVGL
jgi:hypothetical protein